ARGVLLRHPDDARLAVHDDRAFAHAVEPFEEALPGDLADRRGILESAHVSPSGHPRALAALGAVSRYLTTDRSCPKRTLRSASVRMPPAPGFTSLIFA